MDKISVIVPIALTEQRDPEKSWRHSVNEHARLRSQFMLRSFLREFDAGGIAAFQIVCPDRDYPEIRKMADGERAPCAIVVTGESEFFTQCGIDAAFLSGLPGWKLQQIIKLAFAKICPTGFYLTLDSDIVQFREAGVATLFPDGRRALAGIETAADYERLYTPEFSCREVDAKRNYYQASQHLLAYHRPEDRSGIFFSETPVVMSRRGVLDLFAYLEQLHRKSVVEVLSGVLAEHSGWTEYSLYFQFLEQTGALSEIYTFGDCNAVLALDKSIWQPTSCYNSPRFYDRPHFSSDSLVREGPFLAIQSWIPVKEWLPVNYRDLPDFYRRLAAWLAPPGSAEAETERTGAAESLDAMQGAAFLQILERVDPSSALYRRSREVLESSLEVGQRLPPPTPPKAPAFLTIGMTTFNDYDGCYFTIQAIRLYHPEILRDVELLIIDNNPTGPCAQALKSLEYFIPNYRYIPYRSHQGTAVRDLLFREATGEFVLCIDCHVFFPAGALSRLIEYCRAHPDSNDLLQGPLISDALEPMATQFDPIWSHGMYGHWGMDKRGEDPDGEPFEIGMQGLGAFACRREAWPGFNPRLTGFGGEEGYLHEKIRRNGGRNLCLPFLRWMHRFERPMGVPYRPRWEERIRNYLLIYHELGLDPAPVIEHFETLLGKEPAGEAVRWTQAEIASPFQFFDAIYCINLDRETQRWADMQRRFRKLGIDGAVRRLPAAETPLNQHIGCALSHRRILVEAKRQGLNSVLVFEDDARFTADAAEVLRSALQELKERELAGQGWQLLYLGGYCAEESVRKVPGCHHLAIPGLITCTHAIAYHHSVYDAILDAVPESTPDLALWTRKHLAIDQFYTLELQRRALMVSPVIATQTSIIRSESREFEE